MIFIGMLDMIVGFSLAGISTQSMKYIDIVELCAAFLFVSGCLLIGAALQLVC